MATIVTDRTAATRPVSTGRRDLTVALASVWLVGGLYMDGWAHSHISELETFFTPWHGVLYSGYLAVAVSLVPAQLWRGRPEGPIRSWVPAGYGLGLLGAMLFAVGGLVDMTWHTVFGVEVSLEALLSPPHLLLLTAGVLMIATPIRAEAEKRTEAERQNRAERHNRTERHNEAEKHAEAEKRNGAERRTAVVNLGRAFTGAELPVLVSATTMTAMAAFFLDYLSPFTDVPSTVNGYSNDQSFGLAQHLAYSVLIVVSVLYTWSRLERIPTGLVTLVVAAASVPNGVFGDFENLSAQLWPLAGAVLADVALRWIAARRAGLTPLAAGAVIPLLIWPAHLIGVELSRGVAWSLELWSGVVVLTTLAGAVLGGLFLPRARTRRTLTTRADEQP